MEKPDLLWVDLKIRKLLDKMSEEDYNLLIKLCNNKNVKHTLETVPREYPLKIILLILFYEPRFLYFIKLIF